MMEVCLTITAQDVSKLQRIIALAQKLVASGSKPKRARPSKLPRAAVPSRRKNGKRIRRSGADLVRFRRKLKSERRKGIPVADIAHKHGVTPAYIYMLG